MKMKRREFLIFSTAFLSQISESKFKFFSRHPEPISYTTENGKPFEKFYTQRMHPDYITALPGVEYFFLGNGEIIAVIQLCQDERTNASLFGLTLWDAERFTRKWSTFLYHPERGFENTKLTVKFGDEFFTLDRGNFKKIYWDLNRGFPVVKLIWGNEKLEVEEEFFVPIEGKILFRNIKVTNKTNIEIPTSLRLQLYPNFGLFDEIFTSEKDKTAYAKGYTTLKLQTLSENAKTSGRYDLWVELEKGVNNAIYIYSLSETKRREQKMTSKNFIIITKKTSSFWNDKTKIETDSEILNSLFNVSKICLKSTIAKSGKRDSGIWQYNMEWVRDDSMFLIGLLMCGFFEEAKTMLIKMLEKFVGPEGQTIESSRWFGYELTELDQNGELLYALWSYVCWTGDFEILKRYWDKIKLVAEFPLKDVFWDKTTKLLKNKREFWERTDTFGVEEGYELAYQFWVSFGLKKASELAKKLGYDALSRRWSLAADEIKNSMIKIMVHNDETGKKFFIKRRKVNGEWQRYFIPPDRKRMPQNSPIATEPLPSAEPDTSEVLPIVYGFVDPKDDICIGTLERIEKLWNQRWNYGGYERYDSSSEPEPPGPWPFASLFVARAYMEMNDQEKVWRVLNWLYNINGGKSGAWFEYYPVEQLTPPLPPIGIVGWTWAELVALVIYHIVGIKPEIENLKIKPSLLKNLNFINANFKIRQMEIDLSIERGKEIFAIVGDKKVEMKNQTLTVPYSQGKMKIKISTI
jgi:hypothetical protein